LLVGSVNIEHCGKLWRQPSKNVKNANRLKAVGWDITPYANVAAWLARCALTIPDYAAANQAGADQFGKTVRSKLAPGQI
jgi:hypothetical protein